MNPEEQRKVAITTTQFKESSLFLGDRNFMNDLTSSITLKSWIVFENSQNIETDFLEILGNKYMSAILSRTSVKECSASELSSELKIPLATVYRKLKLLEESGLVENVKTIINISGNEEKFYHCLISEATVNFHNGYLSMKVKMIDHVNKITRIWKRFTKYEDMTNKEGMKD